MVFFGPLSSVYDFGTFAVMLLVFHAHASLFRSGWFVESLATQALVIFVIRTRRVPFFSSRPSRPLLAATLAVVAVAVALPYSPLASVLGFHRLPLLFLAIVGGMTATYLLLAELGKALFFRSPHVASFPQPRSAAPPMRPRRSELRLGAWRPMRRPNPPSSPS